MSYDYTAKRVGSKQPPHGHKVIICAKCGQRGTNDGIMTNKKTGIACQSVTHRSHIEVVAGIAMNHVDEWCSYFVSKAEGQAEKKAEAR